MTRRTTTDLKSRIDTLLPDNTTGDISAADVRSVTYDIADSFIPMPLPPGGNGRFYLANTPQGLQYSTLNLTDVTGIDDDGAGTGDVLLYNAANSQFEAGRLLNLKQFDDSPVELDVRTGSVRGGDLDGMQFFASASYAALGTPVDRDGYTVVILSSGIKIFDGALTGLPRAEVDMSQIHGSMMPPAGTTAQQPITTHEGQMRYDTDLGAYRFRDASGWFSLNAAALRGGGSSEYVLPEKLAALNDALTIEHSHTTGWRVVPGADTTGIERLYRYAFGESRRSSNTESPSRTNGFEDVLPAWQGPALGPGNYVYFADVNDALNDAHYWPGVHDFFRYFAGDGDTLREWYPTGLGDFSASGTRGVPDADMLQGVAFRMTSPADESSPDRAILSIGDSDDPYGKDNGGLIGHSVTEGLYLRSGDGGGETRTEATTIELGGNPHHPMRFHGDIDSGVTLDEQYWTVPEGVTEITITSTFYNNGVDSGSHTITYTVPSADADDDTTFFVGIPGLDGSGLVGRLRYRASDRHLFVVAALPNAGAAFIVRATYASTRSYTLAERYTRVALGTGDPHDRHGVFQGVLWDINRREPQQTLLYFHPADPNTAADDPEMAVSVVVRNPNTGTQHAPVTRSLGHRMSEIGWNGEVHIVDSAMLYRQMQAYQVERTRNLTDAELARMTRNFDDALGLWTNREEDRTEISIAGLQSPPPNVSHFVRTVKTGATGVFAAFPDRDQWLMTYVLTRADMDLFLAAFDAGFRSMNLSVRGTFPNGHDIYSCDFSIPAWFVRNDFDSAIGGRHYFRSGALDYYLSPTATRKFSMEIQSGEFTGSSVDGRVRRLLQLTFAVNFQIPNPNLTFDFTMRP